MAPKKHTEHNEDGERVADGVTRLPLHMPVSKVFRLVGSGEQSTYVFSPKKTNIRKIIERFDPTKLVDATYICDENKKTILIKISQ